MLQPLKWMSEQIYWKLEGYLFRMELAMVTWWSHSAGYHIQEIGQDVFELIDEPCLVMINHQSMSDVPLLMAAWNQRRDLHNNIMWIMANGFKYSVFGVVSQGHKDFFIKDGKSVRELAMQELKEHLKNSYLPLKRRWLVIFPEGDFLSRRKDVSQKFAKKNGYPVLEHCLLPRINGLKVILDNAAADKHTDKTDKIKYVIDVTMAYPDGGQPLDLQSIFGGYRPPCNTLLHYRKYNIEEVPRDEDGLTSWVNARYKEKDELLQKFYETGVFPDSKEKLEKPIISSQDQKEDQLPKLNGDKVVQNPLEFFVIHSFCLGSSYMAYNVMSRMYEGSMDIMNHLSEGLSHAW